MGFVDRTFVRTCGPRSTCGLLLGALHGCGQSQVVRAGRVVRADEPENEQKLRVSPELRGFGTLFQRQMCCRKNEQKTITFLLEI